MVVDPDSTYYLDERNPRIGEFNRKTRKKLNQVGAPHDICSFNDLPRLPDTGRYKLIIFTTQFVMNPEREKILRNTVLKNGKTVVWFYAPGIVNAGKWDPENVKKLCGTEFETPGINKTGMDNWTSIYIHNPESLDSEAIRKFAEAAGVHCYTPHGFPVYANNKLLTVHCGEAAELTVSLPEKTVAVKELYRGETFADTNAFSVKTSGPDTLLFLLAEA